MTPTPPPLLPATALDRVGKLARFDGLTVLAVVFLIPSIPILLVIKANYGHWLRRVHILRNLIIN